MKSELKEDEVPPQNLVPEIENEEEEKVDEELQKEMKKVKIDDSIFSDKENQNLKEKKEKEKEKEEKKIQKKKGIDFMDYANENNIPINIQYEEDKYPRKKNYNKNYQRNDKYNNHNNHYNNYKKNGKYNKGYKKQNNHNYNNNNNYNNNHNYNNNKFYKYGGNKFDSININNNNQYQNNYQNIIFKDDKDILSYLENTFGENNLNKDLYIRNRINDKGEILIDDLLNYHVLKKNNISSEKIIELIKNNQNLEIIEIDNKKYIYIKNYNNLKLNPVEQIYANKKAFKMKQQYYFQNPFYYMNYNYIPYFDYFNQNNIINNNYSNDNNNNKNEDNQK